MQNAYRLLLVVLLAAALPGCSSQKGPEPAPPARATVASPPAGSPLAKVQTGMSEREVESLLGPPTGENEYITGKAFIPFFYGRDRTRLAYFYRGVGRVVFAGGGGFSRNWRVSHVEYDPSEPGRAR
jgi:predicted small lipoprotein YifL